MTEFLPPVCKGRKERVGADTIRPPKSDKFSGNILASLVQREVLSESEAEGLANKMFTIPQSLTLFVTAPFTQGSQDRVTNIHRTPASRLPARSVLLPAAEVSTGHPHPLHRGAERRRGMSAMTTPCRRADDIRPYNGTLQCRSTMASATKNVKFPIQFIYNNSEL